ncbi:MAG: epsF 1 [Verrucomicrobiales bacterium]|nr:epsF 1 [Verrucomicrobiales bacterium]
MPTFQYRALQSDGTIATGELDAGGRQEAFRQMEGRGLRPISLAERAGNAKAKANGKAASTKTIEEPVADTSKIPKLSFGGGNKISARILENFTRLLSSLLAAGVPLSRALVILRKEASTPLASQKWKEVHELVIDGMSLADAMARSPDVFPRVYVAMVQAGETGGFLDLVLAQIADFQSRDKELRGKVLAALTYPIILVILSIVVIIVLLVVFIPNFMPVFTSFGGELPLLTKIILAVSNAVRHYGLFVAVGLAMAVLLIRNWFVSEKGRRTWETIILRAPVIGKLSAQFAMARFCRMLGTLLAAGVPLVQSLNVARKSIGNQVLVDAVSNAIERVKEGSQLGQSLSDCRDLFPGSALEMISVAEESGKLDQELVRLANVTESDLDRNMKTAVSLVEPMLLFAVAALVGTIVIGMVVPIFSLQQYIK